MCKFSLSLTYVIEVSCKQELFEAIVIPITVDYHNDQSLNKDKISFTHQWHCNIYPPMYSFMDFKMLLINFAGTKNLQPVVEALFSGMWGANVETLYD